MNLESLLNELLLDIFAYFWGENLLNVFYGLNTRFNQLLYQEFHDYQFCTSVITNEPSDRIYENHWPAIANRITNLMFFHWNAALEPVSGFLSYTSLFDQFTYLRSLTVSSKWSTEILTAIIHGFSGLLKLTYLSVFSMGSIDNEFDSKLIINSIWSLPKLIHCRLRVKLKGENLSQLLSKRSTSIEDLAMSNFTYDYNNIHTLFAHTPNLKRLSLSLSSLCLAWENLTASSFPMLSDFKTTVFSYMNYDLLLSFFKNVPNLRRLNVKLHANCIDGYQWEALIRTYLKKLKIFQLSMHQYRISRNGNISPTLNHLFNSFRTSFWINEHKWYTQCIGESQRSSIYVNTSASPPFELSCDEKIPDAYYSTYPDDH